MKISEENIEILMLTLHQKIETIADTVSKQIADGELIDKLIYPPNGGLLDEEQIAIEKLKSVPNIRTGLRKIIADSSASIFFEFFCMIDGVSDPDEELGEWTEISLVDKSDTISPPDDMLHNVFFESYWKWRNQRSEKDWKLDNYEG